MSNTEMLYLGLAILGGLVGLYGTFHNTQKDDMEKVEKEAEWKGVVNGKLDAILGIEPRVKTLEDKVSSHETRISFVERSEKRLHERIDDHFGGRDECAVHKKELELLRERERKGGA